MPALQYFAIKPQKKKARQALGNCGLYIYYTDQKIT